MFVTLLNMKFYQKVFAVGIIEKKNRAETNQKELDRTAVPTSFAQEILGYYYLHSLFHGHDCWRILTFHSCNH